MIPLTETLDQLHRHEQRARLRLRVQLAALATCLIVGAWVEGSTNRTVHAHTPQACAQRLHVAYNVQDGATERLAAFGACVNGR